MKTGRRQPTENSQNNKSSGRICAERSGALGKHRRAKNRNGFILRSRIIRNGGLYPGRCHHYPGHGNCFPRQRACAMDCSSRTERCLLHTVLREENLGSGVRRRMNIVLNSSQSGPWQLSILRKAFCSQEIGHQKTRSITEYTYIDTAKYLKQ